MIKRDKGNTALGLKVWTSAGLILILVLSSGLAMAAQIDISNCTGQEVAICSFNTWDQNLKVQQKRKP